MEEINESEIDYERIGKIPITDFFPTSIKYPCDEKTQTFEPRVDANVTQVIDLSNADYTFELKSQQQSRLDRSYIELENDLIFEPKHKVIPISTSKEIMLYDVCIGYQDLIFVCGDKNVKIYQYDIANKIENLLFHLYDPDEKFNCIGYSSIFSINTQIVRSNRLTAHIVIPETNAEVEGFLFASAGDKNTVRVFAAIYDEVLEKLKFTDWTLLIGHLNEVFDLKFHPLQPQILFTASKDYSIRLWNAFKRTQLCIFAGQESHLAEILSIDIHLSGNYFVSSSVDCYIKIWTLDNDTQASIAHSVSDELEFDLTPQIELKQSVNVWIKQTIIFSCNKVHDSYVDCVRFNGNFILSKSVDGIILEWQPDFKEQLQTFMMINRYDYIMTENLWFTRFGVSKDYKKMAIGSNEGEIFIFKIVDSIEIQVSARKRDIYRIKHINSMKTDSQSVIRKVDFHEDYQYIAAVNDNGELLIFQKQIN